MAHRDEPFLEGELQLVGKLQQTQVVGYRRTVLTHLLREGLLRQVALLDEALQAEGDFDGVEVLTLDVFDEGHRVQVLVVDLADVDRQRCEPRPSGGAPAAFAADQDVAAVGALADREGLDDA